MCNNRIDDWKPTKFVEERKVPELKSRGGEVAEEDVMQELLTRTKLTRKALYTEKKKEIRDAVQSLLYSTSIHAC